MVPAAVVVSDVIILEPILSAVASARVGDVMLASLVSCAANVVISVELHIKSDKKRFLLRTSACQAS